MGNTRWVLGTRLVFIYIFLVTMARKCVGGGNLTTASCFEQDRLALIKFKRSLEDDHGILSSWGVDNDCCSWERVGCDDVTGRVISLHLRNKPMEYSLYADFGWLDEDTVMIEDHCLVGDEVNSCLAELVNLKHLDLSGNNFNQSRIPEFIGSLKQLRYLNLSGSGFSGNIPHQIGNLSNLKVLDLSSLPNHSPGGYSNQLMTHDMAWISGLLKLEHLDLSGADLSKSQNLDNLLYSIHSLSKLVLSGCGLSMAHFGSHLNSSREVATIKHLNLAGNDFRGKLPGLFLNMTSPTFLDLSGNDFSRAWSFGKLLNLIPTVSELYLRGCNLQKINLSTQDLNFSTYSSIQHLDLSYNNIEGIFPAFLTNMSSLFSLDLSLNGLNSSIPVMPNLLKLDISLNKYRHVEDVGIWRQCHLKELFVSNNILEGEMIGPTTNVSKCDQNALEILYLDGNALNSSIPESLGRLTNLRCLDLSFNELIGPIPKALGKLRSLQVLHLSHNHLNGPIPESLGRLTALREIILKSNRVTGSVPISLGKLTSLRVFSVSSNLLNGTIPSSIGQLTKLYFLDISNNSLQGVISEDHFANLSMLEYLMASYNSKLLFNISREWIPTFQLKVVRLLSCKIEDRFPQWFQNQRKLEELVLSNASIFGPLPTWLRFLPILRVLDLSNNKLTGPLTNLPSENEVGYKHGSRLTLQNNLFSGMIPRCLCTMQNLQLLDLSENRLSGKFPKCLWNMSLRTLMLGSNRLSGVIPSPLGYLPLEWLQLNDNNFNGELPQDFGFFPFLVVVDLGENKFSGDIPKWIGDNFTILSALRLHKNNFTGCIPHSLCNAQGLQILDIGDNNFTGSIPHCFGELDAMKLSRDYSYITLSSYGNVMQVLKGVALGYTQTLDLVRNMDLSNNKLVGEIPEALTKLDALVGLNLSYNQLSGGIPKNIGKMESLFSLDLSENKLTGVIPPSMAALHFLSFLNLSHNNLSGQTPTGNQLQTLNDASIYTGNTYLCGAPLPKNCSLHEKPPTTTRKNTYENGNKPKKLLFYLDILSGFATGFWGIIGLFMFKKQWRHKLIMFCEVTMDKIYVAVAVKVLKMKRGREAA